MTTSATVDLQATNDEQPTTNTETAGRRQTRLTVQGWLLVVLVVMGVVVLAGALVGGILLNRTDSVSDELIENIQPARVAAYQLQAALVDQETAVRGYAIAADPQFLEPYRTGQQTERDAASNIRQLIGGNPDLVADVDAIERAADSWRTSFAEPLIASVTPGSPKLVDAQTATSGKSEFDSMRALFDKQNADLTDARAAAIDQLHTVRAWRDSVLAAMVIAFFVTAILLGVLVRQAVTKPLDALAAACRRIRTGNFGERIQPAGPKDIRAIASDVEDMRERIVAELDQSGAAQETLARQAADLDAQAIELRRSNAELEQFAYVASHDLQEPLRKVASFCQLLEKRYGDKLDERGVQYIGFAVDGAKRMQVLINDLLTFSRVGRVSVAHAPVELSKTVEKAMDNLATSIEESGARILLPPQGLPRINGDPTLLEMLWQNLLGNAIKFRHADRNPEIVITYEPADGADDGNWLLTVSDNGIGIPQEFADKVFVIFQRLHGRDAYTGTGIGLALCRKIVEYHGGRIWLDPDYTDGTRFRFTFPVLERSDDPSTALEGTPA